MLLADGALDLEIATDMELLDDIGDALINFLGAAATFLALSRLWCNASHCSVAAVICRCRRTFWCNVTVKAQRPKMSTGLPASAGY